MEDVETDVVMVDDGEADLFKICMLWIGSFWNDDVSSDSVAGVENRAGCCQSTDDHVPHCMLAPEFAPDCGTYSSGTMQSKQKRTLKNT
ncbi:hypothetical protein T4E_5864 [Trichinella pseudospiralis]|uniref:Uncharacterized protein n=1 Tax=Trichinella pseudospiralis TaxID=6337 RepID=A0A0V0XZY3_TRIPS|nr:hypothetical protein T4E_5864 [Trichinella pseudospiralis]